MGEDNKKNILYGGPEPELIDAEAKSLGEVILKKLAANGNDVIFVSISRMWMFFEEYRTEIQITFLGRDSAIFFLNFASFSSVLSLKCYRFP